MRLAFIFTLLALPAWADETVPEWVGDWDVELAQCNGFDVDGSVFPNYLRLATDTLLVRDDPCEILTVTPGGLKGVYLFRLNCSNDPAQDALVFMDGKDALSFAYGLFPQRPLVRCPAPTIFEPLDETDD